MNQWSGALERYAQAVAQRSGRLLATLATHDGARMRLDWLLDTVFVSAVDELAERGVPRRVAADMLGVSHRTLQRRYAAASDAVEVQGRSVWAAIVDILRTAPNTRNELAGRLSHISPVILGSVLNDMMESNWVRANAAGALELAASDGAMTSSAFEKYVEVWRRAEPGVTAAEVARELNVALEKVEDVWPLSDDVLVHSEGENAWMVMERCARMVLDLLRESADERDTERYHGTVWRIRLDNKSPEFQARLKEYIREVSRSIESMIRTEDVAEGDETSRFWTFSAFQTIDPDD